MTDFNPDDENDLAQELPDEEDLLNEEESSENDASQDTPDADTADERLGKNSKGQKIFKDSEEEDDENELRLSDDAEADLLTILEKKIHAESKEEEEEEFFTKTSDSTDELTLIPRKIDEQHCQKCWLLVRKNAPKCPVHEDDCPIFSSSVG